MATRWMAVAIGAALLAGCSTGPSVDDAWVRLPAVPGRPAVAYATIAGGSHDVELTGISTPIARRVELHRSMTGGHGMATMRPIRRVPVPAGQTVRLAPGGIHAMLFDPAPDPRTGGRVELTFHFDGIEQTVEARVIGAGDPAP